MNAIKNLTSKFSRESSKKNVTIVEEPQEYDILLGRTKTSFNHKGNHWFRVFIGLHLREYMAAKSRMEKTLVVNAVVEEITEAGGRFLKQDSKTEKWVTVGPKKAREKVGHALRDAVGMRVKMAATGREEGLTGQDEPFARRTSELAIARARRSSVTELRSRGPQLAPIDLSRMSRSCNDLVNADEAAVGNIMAFNAQRVQLELGENCDDEDDCNGLGQFARPELLLFDQSNLPDLQNIPDPTPMRSTGPISAGVRKLTLSSGMNRATQKQFPSNATKASLFSHDKKLFDDRSGELSVMSEGTAKKWFDLDSGAFSVTSVDTHVFDDHDGDETNQDGLPRYLLEKVNKQVTNLEVSGELTTASKKKGGSSFFRRKFSKKNVIDIDLSEDFSVMSLEARPKGEQEDVRLKSEEFGLDPEEYVKANCDRDDFKARNFSKNVMKSDEFGLPTERPIAFDPAASGGSTFSAMRTSSTEFSIGSSLFDPRNSGTSFMDGVAMRLSSTEFSLRASTIIELNDLAHYTSESTNPDMRRVQTHLQTKVSRALDEQPKGMMDTVLEGTVLDDSHCDESTSGDRETIATSAKLEANGSSKNDSSVDPLATKSMRHSLSSEFTMKNNDWHNSVDSLSDIDPF